MLEEVDKHYITIWMRAETGDTAISIGDTREIVEADWFDVADMPLPRFLFFENLIAGRTMPEAPANLPQTIWRRRR